MDEELLLALGNTLSGVSEGISVVHREILVDVIIITDLKEIDKDFGYEMRPKANVRRNERERQKLNSRLSSNSDNLCLLCCIIKIRQRGQVVNHIGVD